MYCMEMAIEDRFNIQKNALWTIRKGAVFREAAVVGR